MQGITVGGHKISDQEKLKQQQLAWQRLIELVEQGQFELTGKIVCELESIVAKDEALTPGIVRDGAVSVTSGDFTYYPPEHGELPGLLDQALREAGNINKPLCERGYRLSLAFVWNQFHWDGNKRTGNLMMNGLFLSHGIPALLGPCAKTPGIQ